MTYPTRPGSSVIVGMPDAEYHALPELSSSQAKDLLRSPAKFNYWRGKKRPEKKDYDIGHAVHAKVLGVGMGIQVLDFNDYRTKAAQEARDAAYADGLTPMLSKEMRPINDMSESVLAHPKARELFEQPGNSEVSVLSADPATGLPCRARFDYLPYPSRLRPTALDLKTTDDASPEEFVKSVVEYGYDVSQEWYRDTYQWATGELLDFAFIVVEKRPPYEVAFYRLTEEFVAMGSRKALEARARYAEYTESGIWPSYSPEIEDLAPPSWAINQFEAKYEIQEINV